MIYVLSNVKLDFIGYRWVFVLVSYNFKILYSLGKCNSDVDGLFWFNYEELLFDFIKVIC